MKRILLITILISYSIASLGVSLNYFYCCGKLKTVSFVVKTEEKKCIGKIKKGCCENKTVTLKLKTDQKSNEQIDVNFDAPLSPIILHNNDFNAFNLVANGKINVLYNRPPPLLNLLSLNILYCVFRI